MIRAVNSDKISEKNILKFNFKDYYGFSFNKMCKISIYAWITFNWFEAFWEESLKINHDGLGSK